MKSKCRRGVLKMWKAHGGRLTCQDLSKGVALVVNI